ncbi:MAG: hypothetical protein ABEK84_07450 [Salinibacter sp.]
MPSNDEVHRLRTELSGDEEIEATFRRLRQDGRSRLEAVQLILDALDVSLAEAKSLLLTNDTWAEVRAATESNTSSSTGPQSWSSTVDAYDDSIPSAPAD